MDSVSTTIAPCSARLDHRVRRRLTAAAIGAGLMLATAASHAVVVYRSGSLNIPVTTNGLYLNVVNEANNLPASTAGSTVPGWDINVWSTGGLGFFVGASGSGYVLTAPGVVSNLAIGSLISGASTFGSGSNTLPNAAQWNLNSSDNLFGFSFVNEAGGTTHYGWGRLALGSAVNVAPRMLVDYAFESEAGMSIQAGVVPEPTTFAMLGVGVAGLLLARRRLRL